MNNLIIKKSGSFIRQNQFPDATILDYNYDSSKGNLDIYNDDFVNDIITPFDNIFIPVDLGVTHSDFIGLHLATHIRCTSTHPCQLSNLFLYGPQSFQEIVMMGNELSKVILTRGVQLIDYSMEGLRSRLDAKQILENVEELRKTMNKMNLEVPQNFYDSHSIANLWGAVRLAKVAGIDYHSLPSFEMHRSLLKTIYFKWLEFVSNVENLRDTEVIKTEKVSNRKLRGIKKLGSIDLTGVRK